MLGSGDFEMRSNYCLKKLSVVTERNEGKRNRQEVNFNSTFKEHGYTYLCQNKHVTNKDLFLSVCSSEL